MIVYPIIPPPPAPAYGNQIKELYDGDDEAAQAFVDSLVAFVGDAAGADALMAALLLAGTPSEAIRRLQDDSRPLMRQDPYDQVFPGLVPAEEATTDATLTPVIWTVS